MTNKAKDRIIARVVAQYRDKYRVISNHNELWGEVTGKMIFEASSTADYPVVGDLVEISEMESDHAVIYSILPRKTFLQRKAIGKDDIQPIASNIDVAFIVQAVDQDFSLNRFERYLVIIKSGKIEPVIILNKIDLITKEELDEKVALIKERFHNIEVLTTSAENRSGIKTLQERIKNGEIYCFVGSSGVGKSSIINDLLGKELIETKEISTSTKKGKHTTTHRELFVLKNGGMVIDNPGIREVGITSSNSSVADVFDDISELSKKCKFSDCSHINEPGCAVLEAVQTGALIENRYLNYLKLKKESDHYMMSSIDKKNKDRSLSKLVKNYYKIKSK